MRAFSTSRGARTYRPRNSPPDDAARQIQEGARATAIFKATHQYRAPVLARLSQMPRHGEEDMSIDASVYSRRHCAVLAPPPTIAF